MPRTVRKIRKPRPDLSWRLALVTSPFFPLIPGTKDMRQYPVFQGYGTFLAWRHYTHRLTRSGRWFFTLAVILGMALVPDLDVPLYVPFLYLFGIWFVAEAAAMFNKPRVRITARHADRAHAGARLPVDISITHVGRFWPGVDLNLLPSNLPPAVDAAEPEGFPIGTLLPGESRRVQIHLFCKKRGVYHLRGYRVESDFPFGLLNAYGEFSVESDLIVYPDYYPLDRMQLPSGSRQSSGGSFLSSRRGDSFEYLGNREWREGDSIRSIDWRATGRHGGERLAMREWREEDIQRVGIVLDTFMPPEKKARLRIARRAAFERSVSLTAAIAEYLARKDFVVDIVATGPKLHYLTSEARSTAYLDQVLDILAVVEGTPEEPLAVIAPQLSIYLPGLTAVVCVFLEWNEARRSFVDELRASGVGVKIVLVRGGGYDTAYLPTDATVIEASDRLEDAFL